MKTGRLLGVDWGERRIGLALSDEAQVLAQPLATLTRRAGLPVALWDERLTTARALAAVREMGGRVRGRKEDLDALAAAILLQHYLDSRRGSAA